MTRSNNVRVLFSDDEKRMLGAIAERLGLSISDTIRQLVRKAYLVEL